ncbi:MAG: hypothetical protein AB1499_12850 [Nitrospirota bacterium]
MKSRHLKGTIVLLLVFCLQLLPEASSDAEVIERIVAIVNDEIILLSEFRSALENARESDSTLPGEVVLGRMVDNMLLLNEAKRYRISAIDKGKKGDDGNRALIQDFIDRRIKALIHIPYEELERYYQLNRDHYGGRELIDVRDEIESVLVEEEMQTRIKEFIEELRKKAYIRIQLNEP